MAKQLKVYEIGIDSEDKNGYYKNIDSFTVLAKTFDRAYKEAKKKLSSKEVIGSIILVNLID